MSANQQAVSDKVAISTLIDKKHFAVKLVNKSFPDYYFDGYCEIGAYTFTKDVLLVFSMEDGGIGTTYVSFYYEGANRKRSTVRVPNTFLVSPASAEESKAVVESYATWSENNLHTSLIHSMTIGCDPEIFAVDEHRKLIPAWNFLGSKEKYSLTYTGSNQGSTPCYWDGFGAEFTTRAGGCLEYQVESIYCGLKGIRDHLRSKFPTADLTIKSVMDIDPNVMEQASDEQTEFGCTPSYNAYGITTDLPPGKEVPFRSSGGHLHFGIGLTSHEEAIPMVKALDAISGVCCVSLFEGYDDVRRRRYYGIPGEYRLPKHGLEYRPLSNGWLCHPIITNIVFDISRKALMLGKIGLFNKMWKGTEQEVIDCMTSSSAPKARELMDRNKDLIIKLIVAAYPQWYGADKKLPEAIYDILYKGVGSRIAEPGNLVKNWALDTAWRDLYTSRERNIKNNIAAMVANPNLKF
jgi:hypothetical protein